MVKMRTANLYADFIPSVPSYCRSSYEELNDSRDENQDGIGGRYNKRVRKERGISDFRNECENEIASMKSEKFVNTNIAFYDILTKDVRQLAMYARNESIVAAFEAGYYKVQFPVYASMINRNFRKGEKRKEFLEQGNKYLDLLFNDFSGLPRDCTERILSYLQYDDLRALMGVGKPTV